MEIICKNRNPMKFNSHREMFYGEKLDNQVSQLASWNRQSCCIQGYKYFGEDRMQIGNFPEIKFDACVMSSSVMSRIEREIEQSRKKNSITRRSMSINSHWIIKFTFSAPISHNKLEN
jgi:hypothetical protein